MSGTVALIDGDILVYRTGFAGQQSLYSARPHGCKDFVVQDAPNKTALLEELNKLGIPETDCEITKDVQVDQPSHVFHSLDKQIASIQGLVGTKRMRVYLTGKGNYREVLAKSAPYKGNRTQDKPVMYDAIRERLERKYSAYVAQGFEADDAIAITGTTLKDCVICSIDKDLRQVPGRHLNWVKDSTPVYVDPDWANYWLVQQVLAGDATDNIPGVPGLGIKKADKYLSAEAPLSSSYGELIDAAYRRYQQEYNDDAAEIFQEMFSLVYLCRTKEELVAQQAASKGGQGVSPWTAFPSGIPVPSVLEKDRSWRRHTRSLTRNWSRADGTAQEL